MASAAMAVGRLPTYRRYVEQAVEALPVLPDTDIVVLDDDDEYRISRTVDRRSFVAGQAIVYSTWRMCFADPVIGFLEPTINEDDLQAAARYGVRRPEAAVPDMIYTRYSLRAEMSCAALINTYRQLAASEGEAPRWCPAAHSQWLTTCSVGSTGILTLFAHALLDRITKDPKLALSTALKEEVCDPLALHLKVGNVLGINHRWSDSPEYLVQVMDLIARWTQIAWPLVVSPTLLDWTRRDFDQKWIYYVRRMPLGDDQTKAERVFLLATDRAQNFQALYHIVAVEELSGPLLQGRTHFRLQLQEVRTRVLREDLQQLVRTRVVGHLCGQSFRA